MKWPTELQELFEELEYHWKIGDVPGVNTVALGIHSAMIRTPPGPRTAETIAAINLLIAYTDRRYYTEPIEGGRFFMNKHNQQELDRFLAYLVGIPLNRAAEGQRKKVDLLSRVKSKMIPADNEEAALYLAGIEAQKKIREEYGELVGTKFVKPNHEEPED